VENNFFCKVPQLNIYEKASKSSNISSQLLYGEKFKILSTNKNWIKIKSNFDNYTGYIQNKSYSKGFNANYKVSSLKANIYKKPNFKTNIFLSLGSKLSVKETNKNYARIDKNKWIKKKDIKNINYKEKNFIKIFKKFLSIKYIWGGKSYRGIDCSALLQIFYYYNNKFFPRDTKDQIKYLKGNIKRNYRKGDIIFWKGHVAMCLNSKQLIHAYGPEKKVLIMPILKTIKRIENTAKLKVKKIAKIKI
tara:strand:- start:374 stop:1117 length:744 start_codon:yes stop_codon:yes gene_type:complete